MAEKRLEDLMTWRILDALGDAEVTVGLHEEDGGQRKGDSTVAQLAYWNEFGTSEIPARAAYRQFANSEAIEEAGRKMTQAIARAKDQVAAEAAIATFGIALANGLRRHVDDFSNPPNAASTVKRKGFQNPLIESGQTRDSISWVWSKDGKRIKKGFAKR